MAELLESGCTTAADHHYLFPTGLDEAIDIQVDVVRALGMRAMLTRGSMSLGEKDGGLPPQQTRSEEHTSELQSRFDLVCRLLLEKKNRRRAAGARRSTRRV